MSYEHGRVLAVNEVRLGSELVADHAAGVTSLTVEDPVDFDEDGGWLKVGDEVLEYTTYDDDTGEITLVGTLATAAVEGDRVFVWDTLFQAITTDKVAEVVLDGDDDNTDPLEATVALHLANRLAEGIRGTTGESVLLELDGDEWRVVDVLGLGESAGGGSLLPAEDSHVVSTVGDQTITLTYEPIGPSEHVFWNGQYQPSTEWSRVGRVITVPDPTRLILVGDRFDVEYLHKPGQSAVDTQAPIPWWEGIEGTCPTAVWGRPTAFTMSKELRLTSPGPNRRWGHFVTGTVTAHINNIPNPPAYVCVAPVWYWPDEQMYVFQQGDGRTTSAGMGGKLIGLPSTFTYPNNVRSEREADLGGNLLTGGATFDMEAGATHDAGDPYVLDESVDDAAPVNQGALTLVGVHVYPSDPSISLPTDQVGYTDICSGVYYCGQQIRPTDSPTYGVATPYL